MDLTAPPPGPRKYAPGPDEYDSVGEIMTLRPSYPTPSMTKPSHYSLISPNLLRQSHGIEQNRSFRFIRRFRS